MISKFSRRDNKLISLILSLILNTKIKVHYELNISLGDENKDYIMKCNVLFLCLFLFVSLIGCTDKSELPLRLGTNIWPGYEPLYLARHQGTLATDKVHLVEFSSASQTIQAYRNSLIDAAALTLDEVLLLADSGEELKIVLVMDVSNGGDAIIGQQDIASMSEIKGKRIGVENGALGAYFISRALEIVGLQHKSVKIISLDIDEHKKAFLQHEVDVVVTFDPVRSELIKAGGRLLFDSRQLPGEIVDVLVVRDDYLRKNPHRIQYLLDAWFKTLKFMRQQPHDAAKILGLRMKLDIDETLDVYAYLSQPDEIKNNEFLKQNPEPKLLSTINKLSNFMFNQQLLKEKIKPSSLIRF